MSYWLLTLNTLNINAGVTLALPFTVFRTITSKKNFKVRANGETREECSRKLFMFFSNFTYAPVGQTKKKKHESEMACKRLENAMVNAIKFLKKGDGLVYNCVFGSLSLRFYEDTTKADLAL